MLREIESLCDKTRYTHVHYVPHTKHMESCSSDEMTKCSEDDDSDFEDMSGITHPSSNTKLCGLRGLKAWIRFSLCAPRLCVHAAYTFAFCKVRSRSTVEVEKMYHSAGWLLKIVSTS